MSQDIHSSEVEWEPPAKAFSDAGSASILQIIENATEDRLMSKKNFKVLTDQRGAPRTRYGRSLWMNRFNVFRLQTLKIK